MSRPWFPASPWAAPQFREHAKSENGGRRRTKIVLTAHNVRNRTFPITSSCCYSIAILNFIYRQKLPSRVHTISCARTVWVYLFYNTTDHASAHTYLVDAYSSKTYDVRCVMLVYCTIKTHIFNIQPSAPAYTYRLYRLYFMAFC